MPPALAPFRSSVRQAGRPKSAQARAKPLPA